MRKAVIAEDFKLIADIWKNTLEAEGFDQIEIVAHSDDVEMVVLNTNPDIVLMDINLPGRMNGIQLTESLMQKMPSLKILILTIHTEPSYIHKAMEAGAKGYVTKNSTIAELKIAVSEILANKIYLCEEVRSSI